MLMTRPQNDTDIHETLSRLHEELHGLDSIDESTRTELREIAEKIRSVVETTQEAAPEEQGQSLRESLERSAVKFEASHPVLTSLLQRLSDGLGQLGI